MLKGVPLTRQLFGELGPRASIDNDLLVRRRDVAAARERLLSLGYASRRPLEQDLRLNFQHAMSRTTESGAVLRAEIHWQAFPPEFFDIPEEELWARLVRWPSGQDEYLVLDRPMTLLHLASHFVQHRCAERRILRDLGRAYSLWHGQVDVDELRALSARFGLDNALDVALLLAKREGFCATPIPVATTRTRALGALLAPPIDESHVSYARILLSLWLVAPARRVGALTRELFPPAELLNENPATPLFLRYAARLTKPFRRRGASNSR